MTTLKAQETLDAELLALSEYVRAGESAMSRADAERLFSGQSPAYGESAFADGYEQLGKMLKERGVL